MHTGSAQRCYSAAPTDQASLNKDRSLEQTIIVKAFQTILASLLAFALIGTASAQTTFLRVTGSTAYRAAVYQAIQDNLQTGYVYAYTGTGGLSKASQAIFTGTTKTSNVSVIIKTSFSGSVGGIATLAKNLTVGPGGTSFGGGGWLVDSTAQSTGGTNDLSPVFESPLTADVALADCYQKSAPPLYQTPVLTTEVVGVVPFKFVASPGTAALGSVTNITSAQVQTLLKGTLLLKTLSGNKGDTESVFAVGRDEDSGTRIQAFACSGFGIQKNPQQYQPTLNGGGQVNGANLWPAVTVDGINYPVGDSGFSSGGTLATTLNTPKATGFGTWFIGYLGLNDAASVTTGIQLNFNGVAYSTAGVTGPSSPTNPLYTFWGYEHFDYRKTLAGNQKTVALQIANTILTTDASVSGILLSAMQVSRDKDGGTIENGGLPGK